MLGFRFLLNGHFNRNQPAPDRDLAFCDIKNGWDPKVHILSFFLQGTKENKKASTDFFFISVNLERLHSNQTPLNMSLNIGHIMVAAPHVALLQYDSCLWYLAWQLEAEFYARLSLQFSHY